VLDAVAVFTINPSSGSSAAKAVKPPKQWDSRVAALATFVEDTRHLRFDHPVKISYLSPPAYRKRILGDSGGPTAQEKADIKRFTAQMRALGLVDKKTDLLKDVNQLESEGTDAFYDPETEDIVVFGTKIDVATRVTLVHEMTHALQDQHFNLSRTFRSDGADSLYQALTEGDATRVENAYIDKLSDADNKAYEDSFNDPSDQHGSLANVAPTLEQLFGAPYVLGEPMTTLFEKVKGTPGLDELFRHPIASDEGMLNIFSLLDADKPKHVSTPKLVAGEKRSEDASSFGTLAWYLMLASHVDERVALRAVDGWGGDAAIGYRKDGRECIRVAYIGDTPQDVTEMRAALDEWKTAFSPDRVSVVGDPTRVEVSACEPDVIPAPRAGSDQSLVLPVSRLQFLQGAYSQGATRPLAECLSREFLNQVTVDALLKADDDATDFTREARGMAQVCARERAA
jgi:hypothetical protein